MQAKLRLYRVLVAVGAFLIALSGAELVCRIVIPPPVSLRFQQDLDELEDMRLHAATRIIENDAELFWRLVPNTRMARDAWPFFGIIANG